MLYICVCVLCACITMHLTYLHACAYEFDYYSADCSSLLAPHLITSLPFITFPIGYNTQIVCFIGAMCNIQLMRLQRCSCTELVASWHLEQSRAWRHTLSLSVVLQLLVYKPGCSIVFNARESPLLPSLSLQNCSPSPSWHGVNKQQTVANGHSSMLMTTYWAGSLVIYMEKRKKKQYRRKTSSCLQCYVCSLLFHLVHKMVIVKRSLHQRPLRVWRQRVGLTGGQGKRGGMWPLHQFVLKNMDWTCRTSSCEMILYTATLSSLQNLAMWLENVIGCRSMTWPAATVELS